MWPHHGQQLHRWHHRVARQLGPGAANALLKVVEEPPPHVIFIFATTEPEKLIATIRSRTHHYPFRLVPPGILAAHLEKICNHEGVSVAKGVIPLVVRASGGSVRDALSVLGQLLAGAGKDGVSYEIAIQLLGFTDGALLDDVDLVTTLYWCKESFIAKIACIIY